MLTVQCLLNELKIFGETSLAVQWLRLHAPNAQGIGSIPGWGTKIPHAVLCGQKKKKKRIKIFGYYIIEL